MTIQRGISKCILPSYKMAFFVVKNILYFLSNHSLFVILYTFFSLYTFSFCILSLFIHLHEFRWISRPAHAFLHILRKRFWFPVFPKSFSQKRFLACLLHYIKVSKIQIQSISFYLNHHARGVKKEVFDCERL